MTKTIMGKPATKSNHKPLVSADAETLAQILEREQGSLIHDWFTLVEKQEDLTAFPLSYEERCGHLPQLLPDVIARLAFPVKVSISPAASRHGDLRRRQGYSAAMLVEESRILEVCLFTTLHKNNTRLDYDHLLPDVVVIADEVEAQLKHQMLRYMTANGVVAVPNVH